MNIYQMKPTILIMKTICRTDWRLLSLALIAVGCASVVTAAEHQVVAPRGGLKVIVSDAGGLSYRVEVDGKTVLTNSPLGLEFQDGTRLGPTAVIAQAKTASHDGTWENHFGKRLKVRDHWRERERDAGHVVLTDRPAEQRERADRDGDKTCDPREQGAHHSSPLQRKAAGIVLKHDD